MSRERTETSASTGRYAIAGNVLMCDEFIYIHVV